MFRQVDGVFGRILTPLSQPSTLISVVVASVLTTVTGPFGTFDSMPLINRAMFWACAISMSVVIGFSVRILAREMAAQARPVVLDMIAPVIFAVLFTPVLIGLLSLFRAPMDARLPSAAELFFLSFLIAGCVGVMRRVLGFETDEQPTEPPRLLQRIEGHAGAELMRMTVDDHYVELFFDDGSTHRLLMRFSDAVAELDGMDGFCIHRSHWVARAAIHRAFRDKGKVMVELRCGAQLPVGPTYREKLVKIGLVPDVSPVVAAARVQASGR